MFSVIAKRLFGSANERFIKSLTSIVKAIGQLEPELQKLDDAALKARTDWLRQRLKDGESLEDILPDAFATVREAAVRTLGQRHFDVQLMGGVVLHRGMIAEMKTGEGKTLVATLPIYLNALEGKGAHVVTVNDYLAKRDAEWMGQVYRFLGMSVGVIFQGMKEAERRAAYGCDVTYGTNSEFGFDYLRDNMKHTLEEMVQRDFNFAIVDEVDSILVDEARTPLIISGPTQDNSENYVRVDAIIPKLGEADFEKDEKARQITLTDAGTEHVEEILKNAGLLRGALYEVQNVHLVHHVTMALRAHHLFRRDTEYVVKDNRIILIDEFTGRMMEGRRLSEGLHQAIEAKEHVPIQNENQTVASITYQNYFRLYPKLAGMTGTAMTEAQEFSDIYGLDVIEVPTHMPVARDDQHDEVYRTAREKYASIIELIEECRQRNQPVLVGTVSIEKSELLSGMLKQKRIPHQVLNARYHEQEAYIIAEAGMPGAVTIATNMAGRGTDIQLGGNIEMRIRREAAELADEAAKAAKIEQIRREVAAAKEVARTAGGLFVIGTERHESRRIDNQLRGRSGRQGDPGASRFFLSLEDDLMRIFGSERMDSMLQRLGLKEGEAIVHSWVNKALEKAQQRVEARHFEVRKNLLRFDNVMNDQRKVVYEQRKELMRTKDVSATIQDMRAETVEDAIALAIPKGAYPEQWDVKQLHEEVLRLTALNLPIADWAKEEGIDEAQIAERIRTAAEARWQEREQKLSPQMTRWFEKYILLDTLDRIWKDHLLSLDHLRHGINLRAYAQRDPVNEYRREAFELFESMLARVRERTVFLLSHLEPKLVTPEEMAAQRAQQQQRGLQETRVDPASGAGGEAPRRPVGPTTIGQAAASALQRTGAPAALAPTTPASAWAKTPRNAPCPCGSGKKYKHCHGKVE